MANLASNTQTAPGSFLFALSGGSATSLQSPVNVTPSSVNGNATIAVISDQAFNNASAGISIAGSPNGPGALLTSGYGVDYSVGVPTQPVPAGPATVSFQIGANDGVTAPVFSYDVGSGNLILGDQSGGTITTTQPLLVGDVVSDPTLANRVSIAPDSATASHITPLCATGGTLAIGSSLAAANTLKVIDLGANTGVVEVGGYSVGTAIKMNGGTTPVISTTLPNTGSLTIKSSSAGYSSDPNANGITFTDNPVVQPTGVLRPLANFKSQIVLPQSTAGERSGICGQAKQAIAYLTGSGQAAGTLLNTQSAVIANPPTSAFSSGAYTGLWVLRILTQNAVDTQASQCTLSTIVWWDSTYQWYEYNNLGFGGGGIGSVTSNGNVRIVPQESSGDMRGLIFANFSGSTITGMAYQWIQLTGSLDGS